MPEIPEVAYYRKCADDTSLRKKITKVSCGVSKVLQAPEKDFKTTLENHQLTKTAQIGKYLFIKSSGGEWLVIHFGMSGKLEYSREEKQSKHTVIRIRFSDDSQLSFICPRKFGKLYLSDSPKSFQQAHSLGVDALQISLAKFKELLHGKRGRIKSALTDQKSIAGIGNLYADEILFHSRVHPRSNVANLTTGELKKIHNNISKVLKKVTETMTGNSDLPENWLRPHRKEGAECPDCKGKVKLIKVSGRSTYFCPDCQKEKT